MSFEIKLEYQRNGESYSGQIINSRNPTVSEGFGGQTFAGMMRSLHLEVCRHPEDRVVFQRTDRDGLMPIYLEPEMQELLRTDPAKYIQAHTLPHRVVDLRKSDRTSKLAELYVVPKNTTVRAGLETLADAFGDLVYLYFRSGRIEHPVTGRWCTQGYLTDELGLPICETLVEPGRPGWATVRTEDLLALPAGITDFYLPRAWNTTGPWISREALADKYNEYQKEKSKCLEQVKAP